MTGLILSTIVTLANGFGKVEVDTYGALVRSYVPQGGEEVFFRQTGKRDGDTWYNGGVPVCWPWFNQQGDPGTPSHGFVRSREWTLAAREDGADGTRAVFRLEEAGKYRLDYAVTLGRSLTLELTMRNLGPERFVVTTGLHPYFAVSAPGKIAITLPDRTVLGCPGANKVYKYEGGPLEVVDYGTGRRMTIDMFGNNKLVLWNLEPESEMAGLEGDDWKRFLCIEPAVIPRADGFYLEPGAERKIGLRCTVKK